MSPSRSSAARPRRPCTGRRSSTPGSSASAAAPSPRARRRSQEAAPYLWPTGMAPEQADAHFAEMVGKQLVGKPAEFAGDEAMQQRGAGLRLDPGRDRDRRVHRAQRRLRGDARQDEYDGEIAARSTYLFDPARRAEIATTAVARMKEAGVTTVILSTDPLIPAEITQEATAAGLLPGVGHRAVACSPTRPSSAAPSTRSSGRTPSGLGLTAGPGRAGAHRRRLSSTTGTSASRRPVNTQAVLAPRPEPARPRHPPRRSRTSPRRPSSRACSATRRRDGGKTFARDSWGDGVWPDDRPQLDRRRHRHLVGPRRHRRGRGRQRGHRHDRATSTAGTGTCPATGRRTRSRGSRTRAPSPSTTSCPSDAPPDYPPWPGSPAAG